MQIIIAGVLGSTDLSGFLDRQSAFRIEAASGKRIDTLTLTLFDPDEIINVPDRAEIIVYDLPSGSTPVNQPASNSAATAYNWDGGSRYDTGLAFYDTQPPVPPQYNPSGWSPRLFGGYIATVDYERTSGGQRNVVITAQDYTVRLQFAVVNKAYGPDALHPSGWTDQQIVRDVFLSYAGDIDVSQVQLLVAQMPTISFPMHTVEQFLERVLKISSGYYRIDYYKRLYYGLPGTLLAPMAISETPFGLTEDGIYGPLPPTQAAVHAWPMQDSQASSFVDVAAGRSLAGTGLTVSGIGQGPYGTGSTAAVFDGSTGYASIGADTPLQAVWRRWSVEAWVWADPSLGSSFTAGILTAGASRSPLILSVVGGRLTGGYSLASGDVIEVQDATTCPLGQWVHVVVTYDGPTATLSLYRNGALVIALAGGTVSTLPDAPGVAGTPWYVGCAADRSAKWKGRIAGVGVYAYPLAAIQVAGHFGNGLVPTFPCEALSYTRDSTSAIDRVIMVGGTYTGPLQTYTLDPAPDGTGYVFPLPARLANAKSVQVLVNGTDQGTPGTIGVNGTLDAPGAFTASVLIGLTPPVVAFKTPPPAGAAVVINGTFIYPLIRMQAASTPLPNGPWNRIVRDRRVTDATMADSIARGHLTQYRTGKPAGRLTLKYGGGASTSHVVLQPGQLLPITSGLFKGVLPSGGTTMPALITRMTVTLEEDSVQPYVVDVEFSDRPDRADDDIFDLLSTEQNRVNAALEQGDVNSVVQDEQVVGDMVAFATEVLATSTTTPGGLTYDSAAKWGFGTYA